MNKECTIEKRYDYKLERTKRFEMELRTNLSFALERKQLPTCKTFYIKL